MHLSEDLAQVLIFTISQNWPFREGRREIWVGMQQVPMFVDNFLDWGRCLRNMVVNGVLLEGFFGLSVNNASRGTILAFSLSALSFFVWGNPCRAISAKFR